MRVLLVLALIGAACALSRKPTRIVGGEETTIEYYPFMARMLFNSWMPFCGGSLITSTAVLSAAHCYVNDPPNIWKVRLGSTYESSGGIVHAVSKLNLHEQYIPGGTMLNDVAVVKLTNPAVLSDKIQTARIAGPSYILPDNALVHAIGWGDLEYEGDNPEELHHVGVNIINQEICTERYAYLKSQPNMSYIPYVTPNMLCTGILDVGGKDACQGDSGGPVIHNRDVVVGITSWGYQCGHPLYPGIKTRVSSYTAWIYINTLD